MFYNAFCESEYSSMYSFGALLMHRLMELSSSYQVSMDTKCLFLIKYQQFVPLSTPHRLL